MSNILTLSTSGAARVKKVGWGQMTLQLDDVTFGKRKPKSDIIDLTFNLLLPDVPLMAHTALLFKLIEDLRQWRIEDLEKWGHNWGCGGKAPTRRELTGSGSVAPGRQQIVAVFT